MVRTYRAHKKDRPRNATYRNLSGGSIESVERLIEETPIGPDTIKFINPQSKFVVATYWWGVKNLNANLSSPCPEDITEIARSEFILELGRDSGFPKQLVTIASQLRKVQERRELTENERSILKSAKAEWNDWVKKTMATPENVEKFKEKRKAVADREYAKTGKGPRPFPDMIKEWESYCVKAGVNYVALNTEFDRTDYQNGINGKPLFIKKILDAVKDKGMGVVYIDGDMWMHKYPHIFDIENVDFMARGWNMDPRSKEKALKTPFYDPYVFETSGGTMYFGNTQAARKLLDDWADASAKPEQAGKADDRILSQLVTTQSTVVGTNMIDLPIEYLWLTDIYKSFLKGPEDPASIEDAYIEHFYCLTGEERATGQGAAANRTPEGYDEQVIDVINYKRDPELFYEYIFFNGDQKKRDGFGRYLKYMKTAKSGFTDKPMMEIVDFADKYGKYNEVAETNLAGIQLGPAAPVPGTVRRGPRVAVSSAPVQLPLTSSIPDILKHLARGVDVELGGSVPHSPEAEFVATDASTKQDTINEYTRKIRIDVTKPMFLSGKNRVVLHLLAMCKTLEDINTHVYGSYMFMSRIRWEFTSRSTTEKEEDVRASSVVPAVASGIDFKRQVHQIWFGGEMPEWRQKMFAANKKICEEHGFTHKVWKNEDRNEDNFPQTFAYQEAAIAAGKESGQSRWAQVADLARLEIVYNSSGIYIDSLFEISPAFLKGVVEAINSGAQFVGCNEDACDPPLDCKNAKGEMYLTNSFFAATRANPIFKRLLDPKSLDGIDMDNAEINHTTGPYFLRSGIAPEDKVFLFDSAQIYMFNNQDTPYKKATPNRFLFKEQVPGSIKVKDGMFYLPGGLDTLQQEFIVAQKGPLAIYHSGLGGTWST